MVTVRRPNLYPLLFKPPLHRRPRPNINTILMRFILTLLFPLLLSSLAAQDGISGKWYAILGAMGTKLPVGLEIEKKEGAYAGAMTSPSPFCSFTVFVMFRFRYTRRLIS